MVLEDGHLQAVCNISATSHDSLDDFREILLTSCSSANQLRVAVAQMAFKGKLAYKLRYFTRQMIVMVARMAFQEGLLTAFDSLGISCLPPVVPMSFKGRFAYQLQGSTYQQLLAVAWMAFE